MLSKNEFIVLYLLHKEGVQSQRSLAEKIGCSLGTVNKVLKRLKEAHLIGEVGLAALEPSGTLVEPPSAMDSIPVSPLTSAGQIALDAYKIENAIILAAGMSSRFMPLSLEKPKGLISVKGTPLIERQIEQLHAVGITDITVIVGYMKEKYFYLSEKYGVDIVVNPEYATKNNTSSLMLVLDKLANTYICASDHYFAENIFESHAYRSNYTVKFIYGSSTEYGYSLDSEGNFKTMRTSSNNELGLVGPACFLKDDARTFAAYLAKRYESPDTAGMLWEEVLIGCLDQVKMCPRIFADGIIYEFDSLDELREFDEYYIDNINIGIVDNICEALGCKPADLHDFKPMKAGLTNQSFEFAYKDARYLYRHPGKGAGAFVNRACEAEAEKIAAELGLDKTVIAFDADEGWKICRFIENAAYIDPYDSKGDQLTAMKMIKTLHDVQYVSDYNFDFMERAQEYVDILTRDYVYDFTPFADEHRQMQELSACVAQEGFARVLCHNDVWFWNFLKDENGNITLIDWEYAGNNYPAADVADYTVSLEFTDEQYLELASLYEGHELTEREVRFYYANLALCCWHWFVWAILQEANGFVVDDMQLWFSKASRYLGISQKLYQLDGEQ